MSKVNFNLAASAKKRRYSKTTAFEFNGVPVSLYIFAAHSFDGKAWSIHDDEVCLRLDELGELDEDGRFEVCPDCMDEDGTAWVTLTPEQARKMARALLLYASKCRKASEVDTTDPELIESCLACQEQLQAQWDSETPEEREHAERQIKEFEDILPPELRAAWVKN